MNNSEIESYSRLDFLSSKIRELENEKMEIKEKQDFVLKSEDICLFENGKYVDTVRMLYKDLLFLGVRTNNVEEVIRTCFQRIEGRELGRLPKSAFAKYMLHEARALVQIQVAQELLDGWDTDSRTLHSDGTSKHRR